MKIIGGTVTRSLRVNGTVHGWSHFVSSYPPALRREGRVNYVIITSLHREGRVNDVNITSLRREGRVNDVNITSLCKRFVSEYRRHPPSIN